MRIPLFGWPRLFFARGDPNSPGWLKTVFTRSRLNVLIFLLFMFVAFMFMVLMAALTFLVARYWWMPTHQVELPVDFVFKPVKSPKALPTKEELMAMVDLTKLVSLVHMDYSIDLELKMPKSTVNRELGNFAVRGYLSNIAWVGNAAPAENTIPSQERTERMCLLPFQSSLMLLIETLFFAPLYLFNLRDESSTLSIRLWENAKKPLRNHPFLLISLDKPVWISTAKLIFTVRLKGLAWLLYQYPFTTFVLGTAFIVEVELLTAALALLWYGLKQSSNSQSYNDDRLRLGRDSTSARSSSEASTGVPNNTELNRRHKSSERTTAGGSTGTMRTESSKNHDQGLKEKQQRLKESHQIEIHNKSHGRENQKSCDKNHNQKSHDKEEAKVESPDLKSQRQSENMEMYVKNHTEEPNCSTPRRNETKEAINSLVADRLTEDEANQRACQDTEHLSSSIEKSSDRGSAAPYDTPLSPSPSP